MSADLMTTFNQHGKPTVNAAAERLLAQEHDTLVVRAGDPLSNALLFTTSAKNKLMRSNSFPFPMGRIGTLIGLAISTNVRYEDPNIQKAFEEFSLIKVTIESKEYSGIPISQHLGYKRIEKFTTDKSTIKNAAGEATGTTERTERFSELIPSNINGVQPLLEPLDLPHAGSMEMSFVNAVANQPTLAGDGLPVRAINEMFNLGLPESTDKYYFIRFNFTARQVRAVK